MRSDSYQFLLILSGVAVSALMGVFFYRELFPEYKIYQQDYMALEHFRSQEMKTTPPPFKEGIKQIVIEREDKGPPVIDRCVSCHVALQVPYFSPTKVERNTEGEIIRDQEGKPLLVPNDTYIWKQVEDKIQALRNKEVLEQLKKEGKEEEISRRLEEAEKLEALKTEKVGHNTYDVTKVLAMHPLIGKETRPFEFHPIEEYGCTSCHSGNGRGLVTDKAHGPVFDGTYEIENLGPEKKFLEEDPLNDPLFSKIFNNKPGHALLFQTDPLLVGTLLEAKCVQCHQHVSRFEENLPLKERGEAAEWMKNYSRGEELFVSQACYACHRINGFARGGVGPELTQASQIYPWAMKRKLKWPQGDLANSTMPNMRLDHEELADIMTFLFGQKGLNQSIAKTEYRKKISAWEGGKKQPWEKPTIPAQVHDLRYAMTVFATEGCASCHRLKGFEGNVGFKLEEAKEKTEWFKKIFPEVVHYAHYDEELPGSDLVKQIEKYGKEIDLSIFSDVRKNAILDEIEERFPETIASFYSSFRFAARSKDHHFKTLIEKEKDLNKIAELKKEWDDWKERVHKVLMVYIETYGLGRLIGPHLNWSGIYRSDKWLMDHFRNPTGSIPRSIMPVFPFDETKFYALTWMLDQLAIKNRDALRKYWSEEGFNPKEVYNTLCAQCHGIDLYGNGAIAEWIYPVPKNLFNPEFLRHLTKERVKESLIHGVKGTPMPPWGEVGENKMGQDGKIETQPVLTALEIDYLVEWLFSSLPGAEVIRDSGDVLKWQYEPQDVVNELIKEGGELKAKESTVSILLKENLHMAYAGLLPEVLTHSPSISPDTIFDTVESPDDPSKKKYYIKKKYYTAENIAAGESFFLMNCAVCHGAEGDGSGSRSVMMRDAKPRMLSNLDWIRSRDDLRLLRSIKYGVIGTSMTPWGDLTNSLQRLQLVLFIRSLSEEKDQRERLESLLFETYEPEILLLQKMRVQGSERQKNLQEQLKQLHLKQTKIERTVEEEGTSTIEAIEIYKQILDTETSLLKAEKEDAHFIELIDLLKKERDLYSRLSTSLLSKNVHPEVLLFLQKMINANKNRYLIKEGRLEAHFENEEQMMNDQKGMIEKLEEQKQQVEKQKKIVSGRISTIEQKENLKALDAEIKSLVQLQERIHQDVREILQLHEQQKRRLESTDQGAKKIFK